MQIAGIAVTLGIAIVGGTFTGTAADIRNGIRRGRRESCFVST
jgi:hypothetical protein